MLNALDGSKDDVLGNGSDSDVSSSNNEVKRMNKIFIMPKTDPNISIL